MATHVKSSTQNAFVSDLGHRHLMPGWTRGALTLYSPYGGKFSNQKPHFLSIACCYSIGKFETELISKGMSVLS